MGKRNVSKASCLVQLLVVCLAVLVSIFPGSSQKLAQVAEGCIRIGSRNGSALPATKQLQSNRDTNTVSISRHARFPNTLYALTSYSHIESYLIGIPGVSTEGHPLPNKYASCVSTYISFRVTVHYFLICTRSKNTIWASRL